MVRDRNRSEIHILKFWGVWPKENDSTFRYRVKVLIQYSILTFPLLIGCINHVYHLLTENLPFEEILVNSVVPLTSINIFYSTPLLVKSMTKISRHLRNLEDFDRFGIPPSHLENLSLLNGLIDLFRYSLRIGIVSYNVIGYSKREDCKAKQLVSAASTCGLFVDVRYPVGEFQKSPIFELYLVYQCVSLCASYDVALHVGCLVSVGNLALCNVLDHLNRSVREAFETRGDNGGIRAKLKRCVSYHVHVIRLCQMQNESFKEIVLVLMLSLPLFIGIPAFVFVMTLDLKALVILCCWMGGLALGHFIGQQLINKSREILDTIYDVPWYEYDIKTRKVLYFMMLASQRELKCSSSNSIHTLNFASIQQTLVGAYSYIALLFTLLNK